MFSSQNKNFRYLNSEPQDLSQNESFCHQSSKSQSSFRNKNFYSCSYCGRIHESGIRCPTKPVFKRKYYSLKQNVIRKLKTDVTGTTNAQNSERLKISEVQKFRSTESWNKKREAIKKRDKFMCQLCLREFYGTKYKFNGENLHVHHAAPLAESLDLKLDSNNLLTVCQLHHQMCDSGRVSFREVMEVIEEQNEAFRK